MNKKIITIAEVGFALIFVIIMAVIVSTVLGFGNKANISLSSMEQAMEEADLAIYNGQTVSGDTVTATINKLKETKNGIKMSYVVNSNDTNGWIAYGNKSIVARTDSTASSLYYYNYSTQTVEELTDLQVGTSGEYASYNIKPGEEGFISPVDEYEANLVFNTNSVVVGVMFNKI